MICTIKDLTVSMTGKQILTLELSGDFRDSYNDLSGKKLDVTLKPHRDKRSRDANAYFWTLCQKLGEKLDIPSEDIYREMVRDTNVFRDVSVNSEAVDTLRHAWSMNGIAWQSEVVDHKDGYAVVRLWYGSSTYNSRQMHKLISMAVDACKEQGIEVLTPEELNLLIEDWRK